MLYSQEKYIIQVANKTLTCGGFKENGYNYCKLDNSQIKLFNSKSEAITHLRVVYGLDIDISKFKIFKINITFNIDKEEGD